MALKIRVLRAFGAVLLVVVASAHAQEYTVQYLGSLGGDLTTAAGLNSVGQATGYSTTNAGVSHAFIYSNGLMQDLGTLGGNYSFGTGINDNGQVTGYSYLSGNLFDHAFIYSNGRMQDIGTLGGSVSEGNAINASGQVTGSSYTSGSTPQSHAFLYTNGVMRDLGTLGGVSSTGTAINASGQVTGYSATSSGLQHAFLYTNGAMQDLGGFSGNASVALAINDAGEVVGFSNLNGGGDMNPDNVAALSVKGAIVNLNSAIGSAASLYMLTSGVAINDAGQILAEGTWQGSATAAFLLTPTTTAPLPGAVWLTLSSICCLGIVGRKRKIAP
jgi:probable HAF family extracellular repeat protein